MGVISIKRLSSIEEADVLDQKFSEQFTWYRQGQYFNRCLKENLAGSRITLLAYDDDQLAGCCHLLYSSYYSYFSDNKIPEINDLNVFPEFRRKKIASKMFEELEGVVSSFSRYIGVGVGLYKDYGNAQRMYTSRGYIMDGNGLMSQNTPVEPGKSVMVDDDLIIYLIKDLKNND